MTDFDLPLSRRRLLAAGGAAGVGFLGVGAASGLTSPVTYQHSTVVPVQTGGSGVSLRIDWTEWYNGSVVERRPAGGGPRPAIALDNVLPGDTGRVAFGVRIAGGPGNGNGNGNGGGGPPGASVRVRLREQPTSGAENGRTEPELKAGDDTPGSGELGEHLDVRLWRDTGVQVGDTAVFGSCDGTFTPGDRLLNEGTFSEVAVAPDGDGWLDVTGDGECLGPGEKLCVGFEWEVGSSNLIQTDAVDFAIEFRGRQCGQ